MTPAASTSWGECAPVHTNDARFGFGWRDAARLDASDHSRYPFCMLHPRLPSAIEHLREPRPIHFPEFELVAEGKRHLTLRTFLYQLARHVLGPEHTVGSDQFVYWNARDPRRKLAPDVFVSLGVADSSFGSWKVWERRTPELAVEIVSPSEDEGENWDAKLERYHELGVRELVRFDPDAPEGARLRVWDRVAQDLVERRVEADATACTTLGLSWVVCPVEDEPVGLRLADADGRIVPNALEAERAAHEAERAAHEAERAAHEAERAARERAESRVRELEAALAAKNG